MNLNLLLTLSVFVIVVGCNKAPENKAGSPAAEATSKDLYVQDMSALVSFSDAGAKSFDKSHGGLFTKVFGGTDSVAVKRYFSERIKYAYSDADMENISLSNELPDPWSGRSEDPETKGVLGATNIGTSLLMMSMLTKTKTDLVTPTGLIPINSTRVGIMLFGPGYSQTAMSSDGKKISVPPEYRHVILMHEARHSDCTGGLTQKDFDPIRNMPTAESFLSELSKKSCGHMHEKCPKGHDLEGALACDSEPWGAYSVGAVYAAAAARNLSGRSRAIMEAVIISNFGRLIGASQSDLLKGNHGDPDMSHIDPVMD